MEINKFDTNILVVGNGFDIYHGLKTKYFDFVQYTVKVKNGEISVINNIYNLCSENMFIVYFQEEAKENQGWIDCEKEIELLCTIFDKLVNNKDAINHDGYLNKGIIDIHEKNILKFATKYFRDNSAVLQLKDIYLHRYKKINKNLILQTFKNDLDDFIQVFYYYLWQEIDYNSINVRSNQIRGIEFSYVVNFNYTDTFKLYNIENANVCYIHGSITAGKDSMVLGTRDIEDESLDLIYFRKFFQRIQKRGDLLDKRQFVINPSTYDLYAEKGNVNAHFFGHSLSDTDGDIIRTIADLSKKLIIYYYNQEDYEQKVISIFEVFKKKKAQELISGGKVNFVKLEAAQKVE